MSDVMDKARGRWAGILRTLGVEEQFLKNQHGPCPMCGGKDRYRWDDKNGDGTYYCNSCGAGDGWLLAQKLTGESASAVAKKIFNMVGGIAKIQSKPVDDMERNRQRLKIESCRAAMLTRRSVRFGCICVIAACQWRMGYFFIRRCRTTRTALN
jgi:putative DNA primase/helicase